MNSCKVLHVIAFVNTFPTSPFLSLQSLRATTLERSMVCKNLHPNTMLCIASNLTCDDEHIISQSIGEWKSFKGDLNKKPAVFLVYSRRFPVRR